MHRSKLPYFFLGLAAVIAVAALVLLMVRPGVHPKPLPPPCATVASKLPTPNIEGLTNPGKPEDPAAVLKNLGVGYSTADPAELVAQIGKALQVLAALGCSVDIVPPESRKVRKA